MAKSIYLIGLTAISGGIRELKGVISNVYSRAQTIGLSIINHDLNGGADGSRTGDCSKAKDLVNVLKTQEDKRNMIAWLAYFGNIACKMENGVCTEVQHFKPDSKRYRQPDLDAAKVHNWYEPYLPNGEKAHWFEGPPKPLYASGTIANVGENVINFAERFLGTDSRPGDLTKTRDRGDGTMVPLYDLNDEEQQQARIVFDGLRKFGLMLMARERSEELTAEVVKLNDFTDATTRVLGEVSKLGEEISDDETAEIEAEVA